MAANYLQRTQSYISELWTWGRDLIEREVRIFTSRWTGVWRPPTHDWSRPNYKYWRDAYYCRVPGLEIGGLFIKPITQKISAWVLGRPPVLKCTSRRTQKALAKWWRLHHWEILQVMRFSLRQGDCFLVINPDLSISILPADSVDPIVDPGNYGQIIGWRVVQSYPHPENSSLKMTIIDEYYADRRIHRVESQDGRTVTQTYRNLIGRIPLIHVPNQPVEGETFGHPEAEALAQLLNHYTTVMTAAIEGNIMQGRPTPVISFESVQDLNKFWALYGKVEKHKTADGTVKEIQTLQVDLNQILTVSNAEFNYESPGAFIEDTKKLLGLFFYLMLEHAELPEFVLGNAIDSSRASAETQMPVFETFIKMRQGDCAKWIREIAMVVLGYLSLTEPGVRVEEPLIQWPKLTQNGRLTLDTVKWGYAAGLLDDETALFLMPVEVENPEEVLRNAKKQLEERMALEQEQLEKGAVVPRREADGADKESVREISEAVQRELQEIFKQMGEI